MAKIDYADSVRQPARSRGWRWLALMMLAAGGFSLSPAEARPEVSAVSEQAGTPATELASSLALREPDSVRLLYRLRGGVPIWVNGSGLNPSGSRLLDFLSRTWEHGLDPGYYHVATIRALLAQQTPPWRQVEALLSDGYIALAQDFSFGVAERDPARFDRALRDWRAGPVYDLVALRANGEPVARLRERLPADSEYWALVEVLRHRPTLSGDSIRLLAVNLDRRRDRRSEPAGAYLRVNIPSQKLEYIRDGRTVAQMKVIVGRPDRPTPLVGGQIDTVVFNPAWNVPRSIAIRDKLPKIRANPDYLADNGYLLKAGWSADAAVVDPAGVDWSQINAANFDFALQQQPGPGNALGQVKFLFPNEHSVYLHDTANPELFARERRLFSSGCVRLERPMELARLLLREEGWDQERLGVVERARAEEWVRLSRPVPVVFEYRTAWIDDAGQLQITEDVYGRDARAALALGRQGRLPAVHRAAAEPAVPGTGVSGGTELAALGGQ